MIALAVPVGLIISLVVWSLRARASLDREMAALRASGEPVLPVDLQQPPIPDAQNAAISLGEAARQLKLDAQAQRGWPDAHVPLADEEIELFTRVCAQNCEVFPLVTRAGALTDADWQTDFSVGSENLTMPFLHEQRDLTRLLEAGALLAHHRDEDDHALQRVNEILHISDAVGQSPNLISILVAFGARARAADVVARIAPSLEAPPPDVAETIARLLDEASSQELLARGLRAERVMQQDMLRRTLDGTIGATPGAAVPANNNVARRMLLGPIISGDSVIIIRRMTRMIEATDAPDLPTFLARLGPLPEGVAKRSFLHVLAGALLPSLERTAHVRYRCDNDSRLAATALAIRWYSIEHDGRFPETLDELVPKYLPSVPLDALAGNGKTIGYVNAQADPDRPRVYHVGENLKDDGGRPPDPDATDKQNRESTDVVVFLKHQPRPATQPAE